MRNSKKVELSPQLRLGVGRARSQNKILKISVGICLLLAVALALNAIRLVVKNGRSGDSPAVLGASSTKAPQPTGQMQFTQYTVQPGDTLFDISQRYKVDWTALASLNNIQSPFLVKPGQVIKIPK